MNDKFNDKPSLSKSSASFSFHFFVLAGGVILPLIALFYELATKTCSSIFFNPIPTPWHIVLVGFVPLVNLLIWLEICYATKYFHHALLLIGLGIGVSSVYALRFLPLSFFSIFAVMFMGIGFLGLSPYFSLIASLQLLNKLKSPNSISNLNIKSHCRLVSCGILISVMLLAALDLPITLTRIGFQMAISESQKTSTRGLNFLRMVGNKDFMLRSCYIRPGISDLFGVLFDPIPSADAREIFYRVTGTPFNSLPAPSFLKADPFWNGTEFDENQGTTNVGGKIDNLLLYHSRIDGSIDSNAAIGYLEWTMVFKNFSETVQEARSQICLPPNAVVSRLTLWIDGEEREAAFAGRSQVKNAYQKIVRRQRDPVLVTTSGPDRILVQCYPVPVNGQMKIRFGITIPLFLDNSSALLPLPYFAEQNFTPSENHAIWIESNSPLGSNFTKNTPHTKSIRYLLSNDQLQQAPAVIHINRKNASRYAWTVDPFSNQKTIIVSEFLKINPIVPKRVVFVVDGSQSMKNHVDSIFNALSSLPSEINAHVLLASDNIIEFQPYHQDSKVSFLDRHHKQLYKSKFIGGQNNIPALIKALQLNLSSNDAICWIHGPQPVQLGSEEQLNQYIDRMTSLPTIYDLQVVPGPNLILEKTSLSHKAKTIPRLGSLEDDLKRFFKKWNEPYIISTRKQMEHALPLTSATKTSPHLARLWARDQIYHLVEAQNASKAKEAIKIGSTYQIVTPVTGAVVLENATQYQENNLNPVDPSIVPTIPEPEIWGLLLITLMIIFWFLKSARRRTQWLSHQV